MQRDLSAIGLEMEFWDVSGDEIVAAHKHVMRETAWPLFVNEQEWLTVVATPTQLELFAVGFLYNEGLIRSLDEVLAVRVCDEPAPIIDIRLARTPALPQKRTLTSGCGGGATFTDIAAQREPIVNEHSWTTDEIYAGMSTLLATVADEYRSVGGFHSSAFSRAGQITFVANDVGRHNTVDKLAGAALLYGIETETQMLISTGRISSEMIAKAAGLGVALVVSRNSPTATTVRLARAWNVTVVGYCRGRRMHIYSAPERVRLPGGVTTRHPAAPRHVP